MSAATLAPSAPRQTPVMPPQPALSAPACVAFIALHSSPLNAATMLASRFAKHFASSAANCAVVSACQAARFGGQPAGAVGDGVGAFVGTGVGEAVVLLEPFDVVAVVVVDEVVVDEVVVDEVVVDEVVVDDVVDVVVTLASKPRNGTPSVATNHASEKCGYLPSTLSSKCRRPD